MLGRPKDYGLLVGTTAGHAHAEIKYCKADCQSKYLANI